MVRMDYLFSTLNNGSVSCKLCQDGQFSTTGTHECMLALPGYVPLEPFRNVLVPCELGTYADQYGLQTCKNCGAGTFADTALINTSSDTKVVTVTEWYPDQSKNANLCQGNTSSAPHGKSPFTVPVDTCFRVTTKNKDPKTDIMFYLNETTGIVAEVLWKVDTVTSCSWLESGIPNNTPAPAPAPVPGTQEFLVQNYKSNNCDPTTVTGAGAAAWQAVPLNECHSMGSNVFFKMSCQGTNVTVLLNCKDSSCSEGCNSDVLTLGGCSETSVGGSSRIIYLGDGECPV